MQCWLSLDLGETRGGGREGAEEARSGRAEFRANERPKRKARVSKMPVGCGKGGDHGKYQIFVHGFIRL